MSIYNLCEYGIPLSTAQLLDEKDVDLIDIKVLGADILNKIWGKNSKKIIDILEATNAFYEVHNNEYVSCYALSQEGLSLRTCDLLFEKNIHITDLIDIEISELSEKYDISRTIGNQLLEAYNNFKKNIKLPKKRDYTVKLNQILQNYLTDNSVSFIQLKNYLKLNTNYYVENLQSDLETLKNNKKIEFTMDGLKYKYSKLRDYINENFDEKTKSVLIARFSGLTLAEIGNEYNLTRERIRQIVSKKLAKIPRMYEDKYSAIFEKYCWSSEEFTTVFQEDNITYYYLKDKYNLGVEEISQTIIDEDLTNEQISRINAFCKIENVFGEQIRVTRNEVLKAIIKKHAQNEITSIKLASLFNDYVDAELSDYQLQKFDDRTLESVASRLNVAVFGLGKKLRYYNFDELSEKDISLLKELMEVSDGFYSTSVIFDNNKAIMGTLDIRNEYELHNILKWRVDDDENNIEFLRMPTFIVGYKDKTKFFIDKLTELSPISVNDFLEILEKDYGHKIGTMAAYVTTEFRNEIKDDILEVVYHKLSEPEIQKFKELFNMDIYTVKEIKQVFESHGYDNPGSLINNYNMSLIGYRIRSNYIIKKEIYSIDEYIANTVKEIDFYKYDNKPYLKFPAFYNTLSKLEKNFEILKLNEFEYITYKKMKQLGISKEFLYNIREEIKSELQKKRYLSTSNIRQVIGTTILDDYGFDDIFYESIISTIDEAKTLRINNNKLFSIIESNLSRAAFVEYCLKKYGSINIDKLSEEIKITYDIDVPYYKLRNYIEGTKLYYNNILEKIYFDKKDFYEEVYNNE